jgi:hypothetical protein
MPRVYAFQVDDETESKIELDRAALSADVGYEMSPSEYFRFVIRERLSVVTGGDGTPTDYDGFHEGMRRGYTTVLKKIQTALREVGTTMPGVRGDADG